MSYQIWFGYIFVYQKSLKHTFKTGFWVQNHIWICVLMMWIHKVYCEVKKLVWNVSIIDFWCTKNILLFLLFLSLRYQYWPIVALYIILIVINIAVDLFSIALLTFSVCISFRYSSLCFMFRFLLTFCISKIYLDKLANAISNGL